MALDSIGLSPDWIDEIFENINSKLSEFQDRRFEGCSFKKCSFAEALFRRCTFADCDLSNIHLTGSVFKDVLATGCKFVGADWTTATGAAHLRLNRSILNYAIFIGLDLRKCTFKNCTVKDADFAEANLREASFRGSDLAGTRFANTNLTKADLRGAINYSIRPLENKIKKTKFSLPESTSLVYGLEIELKEKTLETRNSLSQMRILFSDLLTDDDPFQR